MSRDKWLIDLGFEKCYHIKNARFYIKKELVKSSFMGSGEHPFFPIRINQRAITEAYLWFLVAKYINKGHIMYQLFITDGQEREAVGGALNKENFQKKLVELLKRVKL